MRCVASRRGVAASRARVEIEPFTRATHASSSPRSSSCDAPARVVTRPRARSRYFRANSRKKADPRECDDTTPRRRRARIARVWDEGLRVSIRSHLYLIIYEIYVVYIHGASTRTRLARPSRRRARFGVGTTRRRRDHGVHSRWIFPHLRVQGRVPSGGARWK